MPRGGTLHFFQLRMLGVRQIKGKTQKTNIIIFAIALLAASIASAQGGLYSICDPKGAYLYTEEKWLTLEEIIGDSIKDIHIIKYYGGWKDENEAKEHLLNKLQDRTIKACSIPQWNMDMPVELVGMIEYRGGSQGKIVVAQHRVGFQDQSGKPWYFQWEERIPWK